MSQQETERHWMNGVFECERATNEYNEWNHVLSEMTTYNIKCHWNEHDNCLPQ